MILREEDSTHARIVVANREQVPVEFKNKKLPSGNQYIYHLGKPSLHRIETILWEHNLIVNVEIERMWYTKTYEDSLEANHELAELLLSGELYRAATWKRGRMYANITP